jgi:outer membrane receptor for Fe3+-dicitrate
MAPPRRAARRLGVALSVILLLAGAAVAGGQEPRAPEAPAPAEELVLPPLVVTAPPPISASSEQFIPGKDFELRPQGRPADVLRLVPGLIIDQHQGGGKAEQYFLRGFDADHGTDLALFVTGCPSTCEATRTGRATRTCTS